MDVRRIALIAGLAVVSYLMILQWSNDYSTAAPVTDISAPIISPAISSNNVDEMDIPQGNVTTTGNATSGDIPVVTSAASATDRIQVLTNTLNLIIDLNGGDVYHAELPLYPLSIERPDVPFRILESDSRIYLAQSGLVGADGIDTGSRARYTAAQSSYEMTTDTLEVVLTHSDENGVSVNKVYTFTRDSYLVDVRFEITNNSNELIQTNLFAQLRRDGSADPSTGGGIGMSSYLGTTFSTTESAYNKVSFGDLDDERFSETSQGGWVAILQHYFLSAWVPSANDLNSFYGQKGSNNQYYAGFQAPTVEIAPGQSNTVGAQLYVGPKDQNALADIAPNLEKTVDYGWLWWIAQPLFVVMEFIHGIVGNWGWSIILLTLLIKTVLYPLTASSYRSMARMRKFAPKIADLREQFGDDRQKMSQEMMKLYQKEKLNPLGGCLPMVIQMPVFIALYWVLMESVELRQSPFMFWIADLSIKDPFFVLPLLMGASMFLQMQMQQQPTMDPMQAKIMKLMPVMFTFMFLWFPAGLTLYWFINNVITIVQQYIVNKSVERADAKKAEA